MPTTELVPDPRRAACTCSRAVRRWPAVHPRRRRWRRFEAFGAPVDGYVGAAGGRDRDVAAAGPARPGARPRLPARRTGRRRCADWCGRTAERSSSATSTCPRPTSSRASSSREAGRWWCRSTTGSAGAGVHFPVPHDDVHAAFVWAATASGLLAGGRSVVARWSERRWQPRGRRRPAAPRRGHARRTSLVLAYPVAARPGPGRVSPSSTSGWPHCPPCCASRRRRRRSSTGTSWATNTPDTPYAFAGHGTLTGLPRTLVIVCEYDDLQPSGLAYAAALEDGRRARSRSSWSTESPTATSTSSGLLETIATIDGIAAFLAVSS